jgi:alpha-mannosidase
LPEELSFFSADVPGLIITAIKKAEDENAVIIRGYNSGNKDLSLDLKSFKPINHIFRTNMIEEYSSKEPVPGKRIVFGKYSIETFMIK